MTAYANDTARGRRPRTAAPPQSPLPPDPALRALLDAATAPEPTALITASEPLPVDQAPTNIAAPPEVATAPVEPEAQAAPADAPTPEPTPEPPQSTPAEPQPPPVPAPRSTPFRLRYVETPADLLAAVDREIEVVGANATAGPGPLETIAAGAPVLAPLEATSTAPSGTSGDLDREYAPPHTDIPQEEAEVLIVPRLDSSPRVTGESRMGKEGALGPPGSLKSRLRKTADGDVAPDFDSHYAYGHAIDEAAVEIVDVETRRPLPRRDTSAQPAKASPAARTSVPRILRVLTGKPPRSE